MIIGVLLGIVCQTFNLIFYIFLGKIYDISLNCHIVLGVLFFIFYDHLDVDVENGIMNGNVFILYRLVAWVLGFCLIQ